MARKEYLGAAPQTTLTSSMTAGAPTDAQTFTVASGVNYPTGAYPGGFVIKVDAGTPSEEKILCSARSGNTFTVATGGRGYDGTTAVSHGGGVTAGTVDHCIDAASMTDFAGHIAATAAAHAGTAISNTPAGTIAATTVQAAIDELDSEKAALAGATFTGAVAVPDVAYDATTWNGSAAVPTRNAVRDKIEDILDGVTFTGDVVVPDDAYAAGWNGNNAAPTKNAVYDKIETLFNRIIVGPWWNSNPTAIGTSPVEMARDFGATNGPVVRQTMFRAGSVTGISCALATARATNSLNGEVYINGVATGLIVIIDGTNTQYHAVTQAAGLDTFVAGDEISVYAYETSTFTQSAPGSAMWNVEVTIT